MKLRKILLFIALLLSFLILTSCSVMKTINVYQKYYPGIQETESVADVYQQLESHQVDSVSLEKWITLQANNDNGYILQKSLSSIQNEKTSWKFIYTLHFFQDTSFYSMKVLVSTKDKKLQKFYGR